MWQEGSHQSSAVFRENKELKKEVDFVSALALANVCVLFVASLNSLGKS